LDVHFLLALSGRATNRELYGSVLDAKPSERPALNGVGTFRRLKKPWQRRLTLAKGAASVSHRNNTGNRPLTPFRL
jgi:hypothetical protein